MRLNAFLGLLICLLKKKAIGQSAAHRSVRNSESVVRLSLRASASNRRNCCRLFPVVNLLGDDGGKLECDFAAGCCHVEKVVMVQGKLNGIYFPESVMTAVVELQENKLSSKK